MCTLHRRPDIYTPKKCATDTSFSGYRFSKEGEGDGDQGERRGHWPFRWTYPLSLPPSLSLSLSISIRAFRVDFHLAACISPRCNFSRKGRLSSSRALSLSPSLSLSPCPLPSNECVSLPMHRRAPIVPRDSFPDARRWKITDEIGVNALFSNGE